jgi:hypothetical protein
VTGNYVIYMHAEFEAGDPGRTLNVIDRPRLGNLQVAERLRVSEDVLHVVGDNAAVIRLRENAVDVGAAGTDVQFWTTSLAEQSPKVSVSASR